MKPLKEILRSPRFMREVSQLLFFFAGLSFLIGLLLAASNSRNSPEVFGYAVGSFLQGAVYVVLGILIRKGFIVALWVAAGLFVVDTLAALFIPSGTGLGAVIISRILLVYALSRFIKRERMS